MEIEFENGGKITTIDTNEEATRSKKYVDFIIGFRKYPYKTLKRLGCLNNLYWYQKLWIWITCKLK